MKKENAITDIWIDPDDAPPWTADIFNRAELRHGEDVIKPAEGTLTQRELPTLEHPSAMSRYD